VTEQELKRLNELDELISWNNPTDRGRDLTEEERKEHQKLFAKLWEEGQTMEGQKQREPQPNRLKVLYRGKMEEYTIEDRFLQDEINGILEEKEATFAEVNGKIIKGA